MTILPWEKTPTSVLIVGDLMLDEYLEGDVSRISPEAPVPVLLVKRRNQTAGGAANVARNIQMAGGHAELSGVWGKDSAAEDLARILKQDGVGIDLVLSDAERPTIKKTRVTARSQQLVRIDWEKVQPVSASLSEKLLSKLTSRPFQAMILSDYAKGALSESLIGSLLRIANEKKVPVIVDPKGSDYHRYRGAFVVTPNRKEACEALGLDPSEKWDRHHLATQLQKRYQLRHVLITLGAEGMYWLPEAGSKLDPIFLPAVAREVFDVSGAGDTVVAMIALTLASGADVPQAMQIANAAAGRVVEKWGTQPIFKNELKTALHETTQPQSKTQQKVVTLESLLHAIKGNKDRSSKVVFTNGCFDILHAGHVTYLEQAKALGDTLIVGLNSDQSVRRLKGPSRPIVPEEYRAQLLAALQCVDYVVLFDQDTPKELIDAIIPDILVKGADYEVAQIVGADTVLKNGGRVERMPLVQGFSTTDLIRKVKET